MKKVRDKRLRAALDMPAGLRKKQQNTEYDFAKDEVLTWVGRHGIN